ncbi:MAG: S-layer family protein [Alphaproteobacteria bacterium]|nr:S-layer family protein [Alphaproteobacteria bacterium]
MMKRIMFSVFALFAMPAFANIYPTANAVRDVVSQLVDAGQRTAVVEAIVQKTESGHGAGISANDVMDVCGIAGWNVATDVGKAKCQVFANMIVEKSTVDFKHVCKSGGGVCFDNEFKSINVNGRDAWALARKLVHHKDASAGEEKDIICAWEEKNWDAHGNDDFIPCVSQKNNQYYEVHFDDAKESFDKTRRNSVVSAVCYGLHGVRYSQQSCVQVNSGTGTVCSPASCNTKDEKTCTDINSDLNDFSMAANFVNDLSGGSCHVSIDVISKKEDLKNPFEAQGVNNFAFCRDIQVMGNASLVASVEAYVKTKLNNVTSFSCNQGDIKYTGGGCVSKRNKTDDVLKCFVNGEEVDFVFDDLAEAWEKYSNGGYQGISCVASDGSFDGKRCMGLNEQGCNLVKQQNATTCPECQEIKWDADKNLCVLPDSVKAANLQKGIEVGGTIVTVVAAAALTVFTGGAAAPGALALVASIGSGLTIAGGTAVIASKVGTTYLVYTEEFASKMNACMTGDDVSCATDLLKENLQQMVNYEKDLSDAEKQTIDESFAKLFARVSEKVPAEDEFWDWLKDEDVWTCDERGNCQIKEMKQGWQKLRTGGDIAMIAGGLLKAFATVGSSMIETKNVLKNVHNGTTREVRIVGNMNNNSVMLKDVASTSGANSILTPNSFVSGVTFNGQAFATNSQLAKYLVQNGYKVGDTLRLVSGAGTSVVTLTVLNASNVVFNPLGLAATAYGTADLATSGTGTPFIVQRPNGQNVSGDQPGATQTIGNTGNGGSNDMGVQSIDEIIQLVTDSGVGDNVSGGAGAAAPEMININQQSVASTTSGNAASQSNQKSGVSGLSAAAIGAGVAGLGVGAALLLSGDKGNKSVEINIPNANLDLFLGIKSRAGETIGRVNNAPIELVPIEATGGIVENIVNIDGHAVVVAKHNKNTIPFMVEMVNGVAQWTPFTGVNVNTDALTKYTSKTDILRTKQIAEKLTEVLPPMQMLYFSQPNAIGVQFTTPSDKGYKTINNNDLRQL